MSEAKPQLPPAGPALASLFGVVGDGTADDILALTRAGQYAAAHPGLDLILPTLCRITAPWIVLGGTSIIGPGGVIADPGVSPAVQIGEASNFKRSFVRRLTIARSGAPAAASSIGLSVNGGADVVIEDPVVYNHGIGIRFSGTDVAGSAGFNAQVRGGVIGGFMSHAIEVDGWPILRFSGTYFGCGTCLQGVTWDFDARSIVHVTGGNPVPGGGGPNTVLLDGCCAVAFNKADGTQAAWDALWDFSGLSAGQAGEEGIYCWTNGHCEEMRALARADATAMVIDGLRHLHSTWVGCQSDQGATWFGEGFAAGELRRCRIIDVDRYSWGMTPAKLLDLNSPALTDFILDTVNTYQNVPVGSGFSQGSPSGIAIMAPAGSFGRIANTDVPSASIDI